MAAPAPWSVRGTIRDHVTQQRRPFVRFFACEQDLALGGGSPLPSAPDEDLREEDLARCVARDPDAGQVI